MSNEAHNMTWVKLVWDFHGPDAKGTAEHHVIHLNEFVKREAIESKGSGVESQTDTHHIAYLIVHKDNMIAIRDALRPTRGFQVDLE